MKKMHEYPLPAPVVEWKRLEMFRVFLDLETRTPACWLASFPFAFCITIPNILRNTISPAFCPRIHHVLPNIFFSIANQHRYRMLTKGKSHPDIKWPFRLWQNMFFIRSKLARSSNCCFLLIFDTLFNCMLDCKSLKLYLLSNEWISMKEYSFRSNVPSTLCLLVSSSDYPFMCCLLEKGNLLNSSK